ncbi:MULTISPECIES: hypothetical protein [unclassified Solwaraspora]|uniref:hypothetical protein n=1 Tax=unclassified Solwaraspora TaxID=2627926 RepID=UPI00248C059B|nr:MULTISPECIES: hypothetical protein [unclassified Solwaraspora]WBB99597.1 hypothetical protein O7553_12290 [Solwaraspora sp. WMMA2059]WBC21852.1 hypothetical protein O7543_05080 [Solwaraspora sp. WMMA2080]WJK36100.1 hypothetical protein O7610_07035 [Solwaraspora sp. WMMA2065]
MAAAGAVAGGLSDEELGVIREAVSAGRKPKVMFTESAGQIAGQVGQVVGLGDPAVSDEWVVVRFGRDELPFSPADLVVAPRGAAGRRAESKPEPEPVEPVAEPEFKLGEPPPVPPVARREDTEGSTVDAGTDKPVRRAAKAAKPKAPAGLTVTLAYTDGEWTVAATQGAKALAKPYVVRPAEALKMVALVDVPGVHEAVEQILAAERAEAQRQAEKLRAELAEVEARLAELPEVG